MAAFAPLWESLPNFTMGALILEKLLPDACKIILAALHHFHFATR
jgi:hypothetical protein